MAAAGVSLSGENQVCMTIVFDRLSSYLQEGSSGTAVLIFEDNSMMRIYIDSGHPVSARCCGDEGVDALIACKDLGIQTVKFHRSIDMVESSKTLPALQQMEAAIDNAVAAPEDTGQPPVEVPEGPLLSAAGRQQLGALLAHYIGPVASLIMADLPEVVGVDTAIQMVSSEIDDPRRIPEFIDQAQRVISQGR